MNKASRSHFEVGHSHEPCTTNTQSTEVFEVDGRRVVLIDTPGFDDTNETDTEALKSIAGFLEMS